MTEQEKEINNNEIANSEISDNESIYHFTGEKGYSYTKLSDKYNDIISSAATMLIVGCIGAVLLIMIIFNIIPLPLNPETSWLFFSVLGGVFIIFIISGIVSFMHAKQVKIDAAEEDNLINNILNWADENFSVNTLDEGLDANQPAEVLYFGRSDKIKDALMHQFENADEILIYELTEQIYQKLYETSNNE